MLVKAHMPRICRWQPDEWPRNLRRCLGVVFVVLRSELESFVCMLTNTRGTSTGAALDSCVRCACADWRTK
jgi:hypothetical protein